MSSDRDVKKALRWDAGLRSSEPKIRAHGPEYSMSYACLSCKTAHKRHVDGSPLDYPRKMECPICKSETFNLGRHFKAPKKSDKAQWIKVEFLIKHGFQFQKIRLEKNGYESVPYPKTLDEAKEFVVKYKKWALRSALQQGQ